MYVQSAYIHHRKVFKNNLQPLLWGTYCIFITTTPYDKLSHISSMPKIVALDKITVLVDTETRFYTNWKFSGIGIFYPSFDTDFLYAYGTNCLCRGTIGVKIVPYVHINIFLYNKRFLCARSKPTFQAHKPTKPYLSYILIYKPY